MNRVLAVLLAVVPLVGLSWLAGHGQSGGDEPKATARNRDLVNAIGMKFVHIEPGEFLMGQGDAPPRSRAEWMTRDWDESPAHRVKISRAFYLGAFEVTNAQYEQFDPAHRKFRGKDGVSKGDDEPATFVTWQQAVDFCSWLSKKEGKTYRLPTEAEWEYSCRAGTTTPYHTGATLTAEQANIGLTKDGKPLDTTMPVGSYAANTWGLHDMHGNVAEWCLDWHGPYEAGEQVDPAGRADGYARVARGWSFLKDRNVKDGSRYARSSNRSGYVPGDADRYTGFRVVLGELPATKPSPVVLAPHQQNVKQVPASKDGPDPSKPYFVDYPKAGTNSTIPADSWGPIFSQHNHYAAVCVCPNGDVLHAWYTTVNESGRELAQAATRLRAGSDRWEPASLFFDVPDVNDHAPVLFSDGKRIYHFCTQSLRNWDHASNIMRVSDDNGVTWSKPQIILSRDETLAQSQPCCAILARDSTLVLACDGDLHRDERLMTSSDSGRTWKVRGDMKAAAGGRYVIHPTVVQRADGAILSFLRGPDPMPVLVSKDMGDNWEVQTTPFPGISGGMKAAALKLASGALLLVSIDRTRRLVGGGTFAALSLDDGKTWPHVRKVEGAGGYMSLAQAPNGVIYLAGSRMGVAAFNEAWLREGKATVLDGQ